MQHRIQRHGQLRLHISNGQKLELKVNTDGASIGNPRGGEELFRKGDIY